MNTRTIERTTIKTVKTLLKTKTYAETARTLAKRGFRTPRGGRPTVAFVNYVVSKYLN